MREPVHRRTMGFDAYGEGDSLRVAAVLKDERPWQTGARAVLHHMELRVLVRRRGFVITEAVALMHAFPHEECPFIAPKFAELEGLAVGAGRPRREQGRRGRGPGPGAVPRPRPTPPVKGPGGASGRRARHRTHRPEAPRACAVRR